MQIRCHFDAIMLILWYFLKTIHRVPHRDLCKAENGDVRRRRGTHISWVFKFVFLQDWRLSTRFVN